MLLCLPAAKQRMKMSLNITNIKIENAKAGSDKMVAVGILGRFTVDFYLDDGTHFLSLKDMTLRQTKDGKKYIQHAYETWGPEILPLPLARDGQSQQGRQDERSGPKGIRADRLRRSLTNFHCTSGT